MKVGDRVTLIDDFRGHPDYGITYTIREFRTTPDAIGGQGFRIEERTVQGLPESYWAVHVFRVVEELGPW